MGDYEHRQYGSSCAMCTVLGLGIFGLAVAMFASSAITLAVALLMAGMGATFLIAAATVGYLDVRDEGDRLAVRFGPLFSLGTTIRYQDIESVAPTRTTVFTGLGVHGLPGLFLVLNIWGFDAVQLRMRRRHAIWFAKTVIIGTDDLDELLAFLQDKVGQGPTEP